MSSTSGPAVGEVDRQLVGCRRQSSASRILVLSAICRLLLVRGRVAATAGLRYFAPCRGWCRRQRAVTEVAPSGGASSSRASVSSRPSTSIMSKTKGSRRGRPVRPAEALRVCRTWCPAPRQSRSETASRSSRVPASTLQVRRQFFQYTTGYRIKRLGRLLIRLDRAGCQDKVRFFKKFRISSGAVLEAIHRTSAHPARPRSAPADLSAAR